MGKRFPSGLRSWTAGCGCEVLGCCISYRVGGEGSGVYEAVEGQVDLVAECRVADNSPVEDISFLERWTAWRWHSSHSAERDRGEEGEETHIALSMPLVIFIHF